MLCDFCTGAGEVAGRGWLGGRTSSRLWPWPVVAHRGWYSTGQAIFLISASRLCAFFLWPCSDGRTRMSSSLTRLPKPRLPCDASFSLVRLVAMLKGGEAGLLQWRQTSGSEGVAGLLFEGLVVLWRMARMLPARSAVLPFRPRLVSTVSEQAQ
jgi:hypothetical protein